MRGTLVVCTAVLAAALPNAPNTRRLQEVGDSLGGLEPYDVSQGCTPEDSFVHIDFNNAELVRSNLGGQGGRCSSTAVCTETCGSCAGDTCTAAECVGMREEIYIKNVGVHGERRSPTDGCASCVRM